MPINVDMTGEDYSKNAPDVPAGIYNAKVVSVVVKDSKTIDEATGKPAKYFEWNLELLTGPCAGRIMVCRATAMKGKRWLLKQALDCCGIVATDGKYAFDVADLVNKTLAVKVVVKSETFTGKTDGKPHTKDKSVIQNFMKSVPEDYAGQF